jgi:DNA-directed DNA polymerase III PolC
MINLRNRTEFSFNYAAGRLPKVLEGQKEIAGIADRHGTWGHVKWSKECKKAGIRPLFGVELAVVPDITLRERQPTSYMTVIAKNNAGLTELYSLVSVATQNFYYVPRTDYKTILRLSTNLIVLSGATPMWEHIRKGVKNFYVELNPLSAPDAPDMAKKLGYKLVATNDNLYPAHDDLSMYQMVLEDKAEMSTTPRHILSEYEWMALMLEKGFSPSLSTCAINVAKTLATSCNAVLPSGKMVKPKVSKSLEAMCNEGIKKRKLKWTPEYNARLNREVKLIKSKEFEDYFFVVADMINYAKKNMLVGPARGSSCGSLVCYLLGITDIDPMPHGLLFERFIDVNREDLPDIDIDFQDDRRELVFEYVRERYGEENVGRLGNVSLFKAKSAITAVAKQLKVPIWEVEDLKKSIIERSTGDARAQFCIADTFNELEIGRKTLEKYPELAMASALEGHASHSGMHAAAIVITANALTNYCSINHKTGTAMIDRKDAEELDLLKIDALGLRTLTILQDTLAQINWTREKLRDWPKDDKKALQILNDGKFTGIFQYEGYALQSVAKQMTAGRGINEFEDVATITALARPGPFNSGGTSEFIERHAGRKKVQYLDPLVKDITKVTYGVIVYQEQVMQIAREVGALSWEDVSELRRAMSKSMGEEYFNLFWLKFYKGAASKHNMSHDKAEMIWKAINTMGSWAFNRSHAIAYGTISYWCCVLKAYFPLEFAAACLRNAKDDDQSVKILRELAREGYTYKAFDPLLSDANWTVREGKLIGGLMSIKGVGEKVAAEILRKRYTQRNGSGGEPFTPREIKLLNFGETPWDKIFEADDLWRHVIKHPAKYGIESKLLTLAEIGKIDMEKRDVDCVFIAKLKTKNLRDHNEIKSIARRNGKVMPGQTLYLHVTVDDDTENNVLLTIGRGLYLAYGKPIVESGRIGDWYLWKANLDRGRLFVQKWRKMTGNEKFTSKKV